MRPTSPSCACPVKSRRGTYHAWSGVPSAMTDELSFPHVVLRHHPAPAKSRVCLGCGFPSGYVAWSSLKPNLHTLTPMDKGARCCHLCACRRSCVPLFVCDIVFVCCCHERRRSCTLLFVHDTVCVPLLMSAAIHVHCNSCTAPFVCAAVHVCRHLSVLLLVRAAVRRRRTCHDRRHRQRLACLRG